MSKTPSHSTGHTGHTTKVPKLGLPVSRRFTQKGINPLDVVAYEYRTSRITNPDGSVVFEMKDVEVPASWSQVATDILAQKYFRKKGVPTERGGKNGSEWSAKQVVTRLAGTWRYWGELHGYFATSDDAQAYEDEMKYMLIHQMAAPNSPQWFNTGLAWAYGITGEAQGHFYVDPDSGELMKGKDSYTRPQPHACFIQSIKDDLVNEGGIFDLMIREARLFKFGSGTGTNFSAIRGKSENLSGGGRSSGLMSFLCTIDRAAGAIKSGGTTRRAAKMVCLDIDHPEVEDFINWKTIEEQKVAAIHSGSYICREHLKKIFDSARENGIDPEVNKGLKKLIKEANKVFVPLNYIKRVLMLAEQKESFENFTFPAYDTDFRSEAYLTVAGQNSNNSLRINNEFMRAVENNEEFCLINRTDKKVAKKVQARKLWNDITYSAWACADPGLQYDTTINEWHTCPIDGRINASNPCSEYMFLDDTACNLASINLAKFYNPEKREMDVEGYIHATRLWTITLEISVLMAQFPSKEIAEKSYAYRTLGLGYANLGTVLMRMGIQYDSEEAYAFCGALTAIMCGESYATSAEMAQRLGAFPNYERNKSDMLRVIRNHRRAAYNAGKYEYEGLTVTPHGIQEQYSAGYLLRAARTAWDRALSLGEQHGFRNAQVTVIAPTGTIGLVMDCDTTGIEPDFALVKFKKLVGGGYFKIVNQSVPSALTALGLSDEQTQDIVNYVKGHATLKGCPVINEESLRAKGFGEKELLAIETQLLSIFELKFAFNRFTLGDEFCMNVLGLTREQLDSPSLNILAHLGFTADEIEAANEYVCGTMTIEGAPHLNPDSYGIFDCANRCGRKGKRFIPWLAHLRMMAAAQPFISGAISKTINMPEESTIDDVARAYRLSWEYMIKAVALYRDGSKLSQPLNTSSGGAQYGALFNFDEEDSNETVTPNEVQTMLKEESARPLRRKLAQERLSITHKFSVANHEGYLTIGLYEDGTPGEIFIKMSKEGSTLSGIMDALALSISLCLQYGVPLEVIVAKFTHARFEPSGMTANRNIPLVKSIIDYIGRYFALKFLPKETAKKYHNEELIDRAYAEANPAHFAQLPVEGVGVSGNAPVIGGMSGAQMRAEAGVREDRAAAAPVSAPAPIQVAAPAVIREHATVKAPSNGSSNGSSNGATNGASRAQVAMKSSATSAQAIASQGISSALSPASPVTATSLLDREEMQKKQTNMALALNNDDAPACSTCGMVMVRNGACYKCTGCGETSGCS